MGTTRPYIMIIEKESAVSDALERFCSALSIESELSQTQSSAVRAYTARAASAVFFNPSNIADNFLQQILTRPAEYDVIATLNLNGDYVSDALAAQVGGIGIAPGANIADTVGVFEATHGTAPKYTGQNKVNPGSIILSAEMMLRYMGWTEAADLIIKGMEGAIAAKQVTYDLARNEPDATELSTSDFGDAVISHMG